VNILCIYLYICDDVNICYLLLVICYALVLFLGWRLSIERVVAQPLHLSFFPQVRLQLVACSIVLCDSFRLCICTLDLMSANVKLCNSFLSVNVILIKMKPCIAFI